MKGCRWILFAFPDISAALQRARGRLLPFGLRSSDEMRRTRWVALNGMGILEEFQVTVECFTVLRNGKNFPGI